MIVTDADREWFARWGGSHFNPDTGALVFVGDPPPYVKAHEVAHIVQSTLPTPLFRLWRLFRRWPLLGWLVRLGLELDADRTARSILVRTKEWNEENARASRLVLLSYFAPGLLRGRPPHP